MGTPYTPPGPLVLASASPRRKELLERVGVAIVVRPAHIDETPYPGEAPLDHVARLAAAKAEAVVTSVRDQERAAWVLAADTIVEINGEILGKAASAEEALSMLWRLIGRTHRVSTAFSLRGARQGAKDAGCDRVVTTEVVMRAASDGELRDYVCSGEWSDKAGAYAVQGMAAALIQEIRGSFTNVMGLPLAEVIEEMRRLGAGQPRFAEGTPA